MPKPRDPDMIRLMLSYPVSTSGTGGRRVDLEAERASDGAPLFRVTLSADDFANLMASRQVEVRSWTAPGQAFCPNPADHTPPCEEDQQEAHGDCHGTVREYVAHVDFVLGKRKGQTLYLCAGHAQFRGPQIIRKQHTSAVVLP